MATDPQNDSTTIIPPDAAASSAGLVGNILNNRYAIEKELKRGGFGVVYLAKDLQLHSRPVVVKVLLEDAYKSEYVLLKFRQEVEALSRLDHPGVVGIIDAGELQDGKPFIVMQYVDGITLRSLITSEGMDLRECANIIRQIGRALTAAHDKGIFHRDLKPDNVMLQNLGHGEQQVKVIDFGIAKIKNSVVAPSTHTSVSAGTVAYMAPEQLRGEEVTAATDVYALATIAYEMLTGRKPFNPDTGFVLLDLQREGVRINPTDLRPAVPPGAQATILKSLAFDPQKRHQSARAFADELGSSLEKPGASPTTTTSEPLPTQIATGVVAANTGDKTVAATFPVVSAGVAPGKRHQSKARTPIISGALVAALLLAIAIFYFASNRKPVSAPQAVSQSTTRDFNYWLTVQKMRDGKPYQDPFESSGQEIFEDGWKFRMNFESPDAGYLYLLNEGPATDGTTTLTVLFPNPYTNSGTSSLSGGQQMQTGWMLFDKHQGSEKFWLVWGTSSVPELEAVKGVVNPTDQGTIKDANQVAAVRKFLNATRPKVEVQKDANRKQTTVRSLGTVTAHLIELEHH